VIELRYKNRETGFHELNVFAKLVWLVSIFVLALVFSHPLYLLLLFWAILPSVAVAKVWREWLTSMRFAAYLALAIVVINVLVSHHGSHILYQAPINLPVVGTPVITLEAIAFGFGMALRLLVLISAFSIINLTVHPDDMMLAMTKINLPYKSVMVTSLSSRFIPTLMEDIERIRDVQRARGLELDKGALAQRVKHYSAVIIPLLSNSLDRAVQVAEAMESRAFGNGIRRTFYKEMKVSQLDILTIVSGFLLLMLGILMRYYGYGGYRYYPTLEAINPDGLELALLALLVLLISGLALWALVKKGLEID